MILDDHNVIGDEGVLCCHLGDILIYPPGLLLKRRRWQLQKPRGSHPPPPPPPPPHLRLPHQEVHLRHSQEGVPLPRPPGQPPPPHTRVALEVDNRLR